MQSSTEGNKNLADIKLTGIVIRAATNADGDKIKALVFSVLAEHGLAPDSQTTDADLNDIENYYIKRGGWFEIVEDKQGNLLGTIGLYPVEGKIGTGKTGELRKMYLAPSVRRRGLGTYLLERTINQARRLGFQHITLETAAVLQEAIRLYTRFGFEPIPREHLEHLSARCDQAYILHL